MPGQSQPIRSVRRFRTLILGFALLASFLCAVDGGQWWQDDCHASGTACAEGGDPCEMLQALLTVKPTTAIVATCVARAVPVFTALPCDDCNLVSVDRSAASVRPRPPLAATRHPRPPPV